MSKWSKANNKYYVRGYGFVGTSKCCRCNKATRSDRIVKTVIPEYELCVRCYGKVTEYKSIRELFSPAKESEYAQFKRVGR